MSMVEDLRARAVLQEAAGVGFFCTAMDVAPRAISATSSGMRAHRLSAALLAALLAAALAEEDARPAGSKLGESKIGGASAVRSGDAPAARPDRNADNVFGGDDDDAPAPSAEWLAATPGIVADMHAHLDRRRKKAEADLIGSQRGPVERVLFGFTDFFRSEYFRNVRRSLGLFFGAYVWYITNVNTYTPPDYDD